MSTGLVAKAKAESVRTSTQGYGSAERYSFVFACLVVLAITIAAVRWILDHPYGIHWDEALYFDNVLRDIHNLHSGSLRQLGSILIGGDVRRPPANLLVALPFLLAFGFSTAVARFVTLGRERVVRLLDDSTCCQPGRGSACRFSILFVP
jgi:hypothetical protein